MMGRIYQGAEKVVVWLGACSYEAIKGIPHLERLTNRAAEKPTKPAMPE